MAYILDIAVILIFVLAIFIGYRRGFVKSIIRLVGCQMCIRDSVSSFRRAYELAMAMECRCYRGGDGRTRMKQLHLAGRDTACLVVMAMLVTALILLNIFLPANV